jgi:beta-glucosidase
MRRIVASSNLLLCLYHASADDASRPLDLDPSRPTEQRVADLIGRRTLEGKAQQLNPLNTGHDGSARIPTLLLRYGTDKFLKSSAS